MRKSLPVPPPQVSLERRRGASGLGAAVLLTLVPLGCGGPPAPGPAFPRVSAPGHPLRVDLSDGGSFELAAPPVRILPANAGTVDFLSLLVDPERVVAVPETLGGYSRLAGGEGANDWDRLPRLPAFDAESVLALEPDLVLTHTWQTAETTALLRRTGIAVLPLPTPRSWSQVLAALELYGTVLGESDRARAVARELARRVEALEQRARERPALRALSYANLGAGGSTAGSGTTLDIVFELAGLTNAAAEAGIDGYASVDHERLLALDPDLIVVDAAGDAAGNAGAGPQAKLYLEDQPELASLRALREGRIVVLPSRLFTSVSTELVNAAEALQLALGWR